MSAASLGRALKRIAACALVIFHGLATVFIGLAAYAQAAESRIFKHEDGLEPTPVGRFLLAEEEQSRSGHHGRTEFDPDV